MRRSECKLCGGGRGGGAGGRMGRRLPDRPTCYRFKSDYQTGVKTGRSVTSYEGTKNTQGQKYKARARARSRPGYRADGRSVTLRRARRNVSE